jgi:hypothetical protein
MAAGRFAWWLNILEHLVHSVEVSKAVEFLVQAIQHVAYLEIAAHTNDKS